MVASKRIDNITEHLTYEIFLYFQRGLFERHKIVFALMLALAVLTSSGKVMPAALGFDQAARFWPLMLQGLRYRACPWATPYLTVARAPSIHPHQHVTRSCQASSSIS